MKCPECGCEESKVIDSRPTENKVRRRRECIQCGFRFTTYEIIEDIPLMVIKKDNSIEPFDRQKLVDRLCRAAVKRPVKLETIENMVDEIAAELNVPVLGKMPIDMAYASKADSGAFDQINNEYITKAVEVMPQ